MSNIADTLFSSELSDTFKNYDDKSGSLSVPSTSYTDPEFKSYSTNIALDRSSRVVAQNRVRFSFASSRWHLVNSYKQVVLDSNFNVVASLRFASTNLNVVIYVVHNAPGTDSNSAFTVDIATYLFEAPF